MIGQDLFKLILTRNLEDVVFTANCFLYLKVGGRSAAHEYPRRYTLVMYGDKCVSRHAFTPQGIKEAYTEFIRWSKMTPDEIHEEMK